MKISLYVVKLLMFFMVFNVTYYPTKCFASDEKPASLPLKRDYAHKALDMMQKNWDNFFQNSNPNSIYVQACHGEGIITVRNALMYYDVNLRKRIYVIAVAPGAYMDGDLCGGVYHIISIKDYCYLFENVGKEGCKSTTEVKTANNFALQHDQRFDSAIYRPSIKRTVSKITKR